jgi:HNH endonuclease/uncharacterized protein DUF3106/CENP-B-like protein
MVIVPFIKEGIVMLSIESFFRRVQKTETCWFWTGYINASGYGVTTVWDSEAKKVVTVFAHRFSYELHKKPIPPGLQIRHMCNVRRCCNPDHLEVGTNADNMRDVGSEEWSRIRKRQWAKVPPEQRKEIARERWASLSDEKRKEIGDNIATAKLGKKLSAEHRESLRLAKLGKPAKLTDEEKAAKNAAIKAAWASGAYSKRPLRLSITPEQLSDICQKHAQGMSQRDISKQYGIGRRTISFIISGRRKSTTINELKMGVAVPGKMISRKATP